MPIIDESEQVPDVAELGITAFTTTRRTGTFGMMGPEPVSEVMGRWAALRRELFPIAPRLATAGGKAGCAPVTPTGISRRPRGRPWP